MGEGRRDRTRAPGAEATCPGVREQFLTLLIDFLLRCRPSFLINFIKKEGNGLDDEAWQGQEDDWIGLGDRTAGAGSAGGGRLWRRFERELLGWRQARRGRLLDSGIRLRGSPRARLRSDLGRRPRPA